ncbi:MAG: PadR family transcriptional regulator [Actinomycetota bacterium]
MRRKGDTALVPNEVKLLLAAMSMTTSGESEFHGYALAKELARLEGTPNPLAQSTLYRALRRLEVRGALKSRWESMEEVMEDGRDGPPRRYYTVTATGVAVATEAVVEAERAKLKNPWQAWVPHIIQGT